MINKALQKCFRNNVKVYPVFDRKWYIEADINGKKKRFEKPIPQKDIIKSVEKTYKYYADKL